MRLREITLAGFRAFAESTTVDLSADCTILVGKNGQGKTSLLDGLFWALTGHLERLGGDEALVSLYSRTGGATVNLTLSDGEDDLVVRRRFVGGRTSLTCRLGDRALEDDEVRRRYGGVIALPGESTTAATTMARSLYLQQDAIRDFICADTDDSRFRVVADLCGLSRATDLQVALQRERKAWSHATNTQRATFLSKQQRVSELAERSSLLGAATQSERRLRREWDRWWARLKAAGVGDADVRPELDAVDASGRLERAVREVEATKVAAERRRADLVETIGKARIVADSFSESEGPLREAVSAARHLEEQARGTLRAAEARNREAAAKRLRERVVADELRALSELALRHLGDRCPVCGQLQDATKTEENLRQYVDGATASAPALEDLTPLLDRVTATQQVSIRKIEALREAEAKHARVRQVSIQLEEATTTLGLESGLATDERTLQLERLEAKAVEQLQELASIRTAADDLSLAIARSREWALREELGAATGTGEK